MEKNREYSLKIPSSYENVFDTMFIDLSYMLSPMFKDNNYNPNMLTTLSVIFGIMAIYCIEINLFKIGGIFHLLSYLFDCLDGVYARRYNMESRFGDYYDHISDFLYSICLVIVLIRKIPYRGKKLLLVISIGVILLISTGIFHGCTQIYLKKNRPEILQSDTLGLLSKACYNEPLKVINNLKILSSGSLVIYFFLVIVTL
jgi:phosphatidylglycerophosphate synthase